MIKRLENTTVRLFAFIEHENVPPTNNATKQTLRDVIVRRKIGNQIRGSGLMKRMLNFLTCVLTHGVKDL